MAGETGEPRENLPKPRFVHHKFHMALPGIEPRNPEVKGERSDHYTTGPPEMCEIFDSSSTLSKIRDAEMTSNRSVVGCIERLSRVLKRVPVGRLMCAASAVSAAWLAMWLAVVAAEAVATEEAMEQGERFASGLLAVLPTLRPAKVVVRQAKQEAPDLFVGLDERLARWGYPLETHTVRTEDGYLLALHRIPRGREPRTKEPPDAPRRPPVLMQHGVFGCSEQWVVGGPGVSPALILADNGYDVWLSNVRGNHYSNKHEKMSRRDPRFWMFSWHEMGVYDVPAFIDHVLNATAQEKLFYVGHSMGNSIFFVAMGLKPEYNAKIRLQLSFGPSAFFDGSASAPLRVVTANADYLKAFFDLFPTYELLPKTDVFIALNHEFCSDSSYFSKVCAVLFSWGVGVMDLNNTTNLALQLARGISGTSALVPWHYTQILRSGDFRQMDHGLVTNVHLYGSPRPPEYPLRNVTAPVALYVSDNDFLVPTKGVKRLAKVLPKVVSTHVIKEKFFCHMDFFYCTKMKEVLMNHVLEILQRY